jgi:cell division septation protein DedD
VGPEINRADAEKIQATIKKKTNLSGLVMKYP